MNSRYKLSVRAGKNATFSFCVVLQFLFYVTAFADSWVPPSNSETSSENGDYVFRMSPTFGGSSPLRPGTCKGALFSKNGEEFKLQWDRSLINDVCPIRAVVSNSGKYVITLGEWHEYEKLPVVVYGIQGRLYNVYGELDQIIRNEPDLGYATGAGIVYSMSGRHWLSNSLLFFNPDEEFFIVRMSNKEVMVFETDSGRLIEDTWKKSSPDSGKLKKYKTIEKNMASLIIAKALQLAISEQSKERETGLFVLNQCNDADSIKYLKEALKNSTFKIQEKSKVKYREYPIRKAASEALKALGEKMPEDLIFEEVMDLSSQNPDATKNESRPLP